MAASESWLLADAGAWTTLGLTDTCLLPSAPETIAGRRNDPASNHPHRLFTRICRQALIEDNRATRVTLMEATKLAALARRCPISFGRFRDDVRDACDQSGNRKSDTVC
ncbi:hypothetical protein CCP1ISM_30033 [Azospirillaceae bacterium]